MVKKLRPENQAGEGDISIVDKKGDISVVV